MKRTPMRRTAFKRIVKRGGPEDRDDRIAARSARMANMVENVRGSQPIVRGIMARAAERTTPVPKTEAKRCPALLEMAPIFGCLLCIPDMCEGDLEGVVACHSNLLIHGKGRGRKADDQFSVAGCQICHIWLDRGKASAVDKEAAFMAAHQRQIAQWRRVVNDGAQPQRFRKAAAWALRELKINK